ncbi:Photosystem I assembly protein Ycf3 [subsurface metagenome]
MINPLLTFNAKNVDPEILEQTLVGRKEILDRLEKELISKVKNKFTYQCLIIAPRGGGKTHMIQVLYNRLKKNKSISNKILIAYMVEDETGIANFLDFMLRILESFSRYKEVNRKNLKEAIFEISNIAIQHQEAAIKNLLLDYIGNKTLIVLIENLNIVFEGMKTVGQAKLRDFMHEYNKISLVATSQNLFAQVQKSDYPFYNFFKTHHLEKLDYPQSLELLQAIASAEGDKKLSEQLQKPETQGKIRAIYELTGGNHRLMVSFYSFLKAEIKSDLSLVFVKTMNDLKPYYEQFIKKLPVQEQKIVKHLSLKHKPQKGKDIARSCFIPPNIISKQLSELYNKGHIDKHKEGKDAYYELKEPLMRICFEINESPDGIAKLFVDFLSVIYTPQELKSKYLKFRYAARLQPIEIQKKYRREALMMSKAIDSKILEKLKTHPDPEKLKTEKEIETYIKTLDKKDNYSKYLLEADVYYKSKKYKEVINALQKATVINPKNETVYYNMGIAYVELKQYKEAITANQKAIAINPEYDIAYNNMGIAFVELKQYKEAIAASQKAIDINPKNDTAYNNMGIAYAELKKHKEAIAAYQKAIDINPKYDIAYNNMGIAYRKLKKHKEAITASQKAIDINPKNDTAYNNIGIAYGELKKHKEAIAAYQKAITINPEYNRAYYNMGIAYGELKKHKEAIAAYQKAIDINPEYDRAYNNMGIAYDELKQYKDAIAIYQKAIDINPENDFAYNNMGYTYLEMENFEEALDIFKQGLEINKDNIHLHFNLLHTLIITNDYNAGKTQLTRSLKKAKDPDLLQALVTEDILFPLFRYGSLTYMRSFFSHLIEIFKKEKREEVLWKSFPKAIFDLLVHIEQYDGERLAGLEKLLVASLSEEEKMKISLMMLNVGIRYLKEKDQRAIYDLSKEERKVFMEFVIEPGGNEK